MHSVFFVSEGKAFTFSAGNLRPADALGCGALPAGDLRSIQLNRCYRGDWFAMAAILPDRAGTSVVVRRGEGGVGVRSIHDFKQLPRSGELQQLLHGRSGIH